MSPIGAPNRRVPWAVALVLLLAACGGPEPSPVPAPEVAVAEIVPGGRASDLPVPAVRQPAGSRLERADLDPPLVVTEGMVAAGSPVVSLDGKEVLFTGKETEREPYGLWACRPDGSERRRLVVEDQDCGVGAWLPDGSIVYARALPEPGPLEGLPAWALFRKARDETRGQRITFGAGFDVDPAVLDDGRIVYAAWEPDDEGGGVYLWTVHPDGTGAARLPGDHGGRPFALRPEQVHPGLPGRVPRETLRYEQGGLGKHLDWRATTGLPGVYEVQLGEAPVDRVGMRIVLPRVPRPQGHLSMLRKGYTSGTLLGLDMRPDAHPEAARLRVTALRGPFVNGERSDSQVLGEVPLAEDGSCFVSVPANLPILLAVLDARGRPLDERTTPLWVRPNETRALVAWGDDGVRAPPNARPLAVAHDPFPVFAPTWGDGR